MRETMIEELQLLEKQESEREAAQQLEIERFEQKRFEMQQEILNLKEELNFYGLQTGGDSREVMFYC